MIRREVHLQAAGSPIARSHIGESLALECVEMPGEGSVTLHRAGDDHVFKPLNCATSRHGGSLVQPSAPDRE